MELRQLRYFVAVAEELNFSRAAERVHIAQSPLSQQIMRLEADLGSPLFDRSRRRVTLTAAGEALLPEARATLRNADAARAAVQRVAAGEGGSVAIGYVATAAYEFLPRLLRDLWGRAPGLAVHLEWLPAAEQIARVRDGRLQLALVRAAPRAPGLTSRVVARESLLAALPADHRLADRPTVDLSALADEDWISFFREHGPRMHDRITLLCHDAGFVPNVRQSARDQGTIVSLVAAGAGVAIVPSPVRHLRTDGVVYRPLAAGDTSLDLHAVWRSGHQDPSAEVLVSTALAAGASPT